MTAALREPLGLKIYRAVSRAAEPIANLALQRRLRNGKEDAARVSERRGVASRSRPSGPLLWIHGASVGESLSVIPLVERLQELQPAFSYLVTTGTVTSAKLMEMRLPQGAFHQYVPLDHPDFVNAFLSHWRPNAAIFVESEFWPNLILGTRRNVPYLALVNGRVSPRSYDDWRRQPNSIKYILSSFDTIIAQDYQNAERLMTLSDNVVQMLGNLKIAASPLPADDADIEQVKIQCNGRKLWLAASTHPGEEEVVLGAHKILRNDFPDLLTIIAPRHPARGDEIAMMASEQGLRCIKRSDKREITPETDIYIADTLGELGVFYTLSNIAFVGGGITPKGGHNPLEPARLGAAILHGPHTFNFVETYADLRGAGGAALVRNERELANAVWRLLSDVKTRDAMADAAQQAVQANADKVLTDICDALMEKLPDKASEV